MYFIQQQKKPQHLEEVNIDCLRKKKKYNKKYKKNLIKKKCINDAGTEQRSSTVSNVHFVYFPILGH